MIKRGAFYPLGLLAAVLSANASGLFHELNFEAACQKAAQAKKLVFIDFYTTWCGPCKMLDQTTWKDPSVIRLLQEKTVPLKIDAEKEVALAKKYRVEAYPTLLLLGADGSERDRIVGYRDAKKFTEEFTAALEGKNAEARAREGVTKEGEKNPMARLKLARELENQGKFAQALEEYLWCFDEGLKYDRAFTGVRLSFLLSDLARLGQKHPPAKEAMESRRSAREQKALAGTADRDAVNELVSLNKALGLPEKNLELLDRLPKDPLRRAFLVTLVLDQLLEKKRYEDILSGFKPDEVLDRELGALERLNKRAGTPQAMSEQIQRIQRRRLVTTGTTYFEALAGTGKTDEAKAFAQRILKFDSTPETKERLLGSAARAGNAEVKAHLQK